MDEDSLYYDLKQFLEELDLLDYLIADQLEMCDYTSMPEIVGQKIATLRASYEAMRFKAAAMRATAPTQFPTR